MTSDMTSDLYDIALKARERAYAPHSNFPVGCAIRTETGAVFTGANIENQSYPEGWCAETTAISHMVMAGESRIVAVMVVADLDPVCTPCGGCRQRLAEFGGADTIVHAGDLTAVRGTWTLSQLLPAAFDMRTED